VFPAFLDEENEHRIADKNLVSMPYLLLLHRDAIDQCAVAAFQIANGKLPAAVGNQQAVPAR